MIKFDISTLPSAGKFIGHSFVEWVQVVLAYPDVSRREIRIRTYVLFNHCGHPDDLMVKVYKLI